MQGIGRENTVARGIVDAAYHVHSRLGPGLLESVYEAVLAHEILRRGYRIERQVAVPLIYEGVQLAEAFRADLLVDDAVLVELKSVETITAVHRKQLQTYLRLADKRLGLLINFGAALIKDGIVRAVNGLPEDGS